MRFSALAPTLALLGLAAPTIVSAAEDDEIVHIIGTRPEGMITVQGEAIGQEDGQTYALVSELFYGGIKSVNLATGDVGEVVPPAAFKERGTTGLWYDSDTGIIFAAGGGAAFATPAKMYAFDALTGELLADCSPSYDTSVSVINDVAVMDGTAYFTDSFSNQITKMDAAAAQNGDCALSYMTLPDDIFPVTEGDWCANGILPYESMGLSGFLLGHSTEGSVYFLDPSDESLSPVLEPGSVLGNPDGLAFGDDGNLYIAEVNGPYVSVWNLSAPDDSSGDKLIQGELVRTLKSDNFYKSADVVVSGDYVYVACSRDGEFGGLAPGEDGSTELDVFNVIGLLNRNGDAPEGIEQAEEAPIIVSAAEDEIVHVVGKRPEGMITVPGEAIGQEEGQTYALVSELFYGGINSVNLATGDVAQVVPSAGFKERGTLGMWYDSDTGIIFAAGGGATFGTPAKMYAFDALTGGVVADCSPSYDNPSALFNDVAVVDGTAYFTDSFTTTITKMDVAAAKNGDCALSYIALPDDFCKGGFCMNGIVPYSSRGLNGLLLADTEEGSLYFLDPYDDSLTQVIIESGSINGGDGLVFDDDGHLYIGEFFGSKISVWSLSLRDEMGSGKNIQAELVRTLTSSSFDNTANVAISGDNVYAVCVRMNGIPFDDDAFETYQEAFNVIGLNRNGDAAAVIDSSGEDAPEGVEQAEEAPIIDPDNSEPEGEKQAGEGQSAEVDAVSGEESAGAYYSYPVTFLAVVLASLFVAIA